jgi:hypothetical protein
MQKAMKLAVAVLPLIFAFAFLVPVIAQGLAALGVTKPLGLSTLTFALIIGGGWGVVAQFTGRWI